MIHYINNIRNVCKFVEPLSSGQYGCVYKALYTPTTEVIAVKHIPIKRQDQSYKAMETMFETEVKHMNQLKHRSHIVSLLAAYRNESDGYILQEYCNQGSLTQHFDKVQHRQLTKDVQLFIQLCHALVQCHSANIIHGDVKPDNIVMNTTVNGELSVKLTDFGSSKKLADGQSKLYVIDHTCTFNYTAPETITRKELSFASDVWALGKIFAERDLSLPIVEGMMAHDPVRRCSLNEVLLFLNTYLNKNGNNKV